MTAGIEYGKALFLLADEEGVLEEVARDLCTAYTVLDENPYYIKMIDSPAIEREERLGLVRSAFSSLDVRVVNLLMILCERRALYTYRALYAEFSRLYDDRRGIVKCEAVSAVPMSEGQVAALTERLCEMTGKSVIIENTVDPTILGGVKLRYLGIQIDGSVKTRLDGFAESLKNIVI